MDSIFTMYYILQSYCPLHLLSSSFCSAFFTCKPLLPTVTFPSPLKSPQFVPVLQVTLLPFKIILLTAAWTSVWTFYSLLLFRHILTGDNPEKKKKINYLLIWEPTKPGKQCHAVQASDCSQRSAAFSEEFQRSGGKRAELYWKEDWREEKWGYKVTYLKHTYLINVPLRIFTQSEAKVFNHFWKICM